MTPRGRGGPRRPRLSGPAVVALAFATLLAALSLVTWRQNQALAALERLDRVRFELSLAEAHRAELVRRIRYLESRGRVVSEAREMGLHVSEETHILAGGEP